VKTVAKEGKKAVTGKFDGLKKEFKKITFLDKETTVKQTTAVCVVSVVLAVIIAVIDLVCRHGVDILGNL
jgi:preprotein translocase subunit SecE